MAHSIPPNLEVKTLNLKNKTKNQSNIQDNKKKQQKKVSHSQWQYKNHKHVWYIQKAYKSTLCKTQWLSKIHAHNQNQNKERYMPNGTHGAASGGGGRRPKISLIMSSMALC